MSFWYAECFIFAILCHRNKIRREEHPLLMALGQAFNDLYGRQMSREGLAFLH